MTFSTEIVTNGDTLIGPQRGPVQLLALHSGVFKDSYPGYPAEILA